MNMETQPRDQVSIEDPGPARLLSGEEDLRPVALVPSQAPDQRAIQIVTLPGPSRVQRRHRLLLACVLVFLAGALATWFWWGSGTPAPQYKTTILDRGLIKATVTATGTVNPVISVQVGSQVSGKIKALYADYNSVVTQGQVIAQVDPASYQAKVSQARASLRNAKGALLKTETALAQRKLELERMEALHPQQFVSQADLDLARSNYRDADAQGEVARAQVDQATAALETAELDLGYTTITSPVNGIVVSRNVDIGQTVAASLQAPTLFVIAQDLTRMQVNANVSESDIGGVTEGKPAEFTVDAFPREPFVGTVVQVRNAPISIQNVVTYDVIINVDNHDLKLRPGMTANVSIVTAQRDNVLRIPAAALRFKMPGSQAERKRSEVWVLEKEGPPRNVSIKPGIADTKYVEVLEGDVREGDRLVIDIETADSLPQKELPPGFGVGPKIR